MELSKKGKYLLAFGSIAILTIAIVVYMNIVSKEKTLLFSDQSQKTLAQISNSLLEAGIEFDFPPPGVNGLMIADSDVSKAKIQLTSDNVFSPNIVGFELFNESQPSMSELHQKVNYQRALQGELEKSILLIEGVESVRVHLAIPREKTFSRSKVIVKAAVTLGLDSHGLSNITMIMRSVRELVSGSVNNLSPNNVSILNSRGELLSSNNQKLTIGSFGLKQQLEQQVEQKVLNLLGAHFVPEEIGVSSWITVNNDKVSETSQGIDERFEPVVTQRTTEVQQGKKKVPSKQITDEQFGYREVTRNVDYAQGGIKRMSVSVIVPATTPFTEENLRQLLTSALSLDYSRGDSLTVVIAEQTQTESDSGREVAMLPPSVMTQTEPKIQTLASESLLGAYVMAAVSLIVLLIALLTIQSIKLKKLVSLTQKEEQTVLKSLDIWLEEKQVERG
ncbi:flagellar M-ring protein FliF C-terminal domain-containing protein [Vibrio coralliilyticus]